jgi:hypothetical protein
MPAGFGLIQNHYTKRTFARLFAQFFAKSDGAFKIPWTTHGLVIAS